MENIPTSCIVCGKKLVKGQHKFCSRKCFYQFQDKGIVKHCPVCKKKIKVKRCRSNRTNFCSQECYRKWLLGKPNKSNTKFKKGHIPWNKGMYWSKKDRWKFSRWAGIYGKDAPNWQGGTTKLRTAIMSLKKYKEWRKAVFERDNYTCQKCGRHRKKGDRVVLEAHHLKPMYEIIAENNIRSTKDAIKCKDLWDINNGETLCVSCHKQTDSYLLNQYTLHQA